MWTKIQGRSYKIVLADNVITGFSAGIYTIKEEYIGSGEHLGYTIYSGINWIISNQKGDKLVFNTNIPQLLPSNGTYIIDDRKSPALNSTIFVNENNPKLYCGLLDRDKIAHYGSCLMSRNDLYERPTLNRSGVLTSYYRFITETDFNKNIITNKDALDNTNFLVKTNEGVFQFQLERNAREAFNEIGYYHHFYPKKEWSGWVSDSLTGEYEGFGDNSSVINVGFLNYKDDSGNEYTKRFEIIEMDGKWSVKYKVNGKTYTSNSEPAESSSTFSNSDADPQSITLSFDSYIARNKILNVINTGIDAL